jgi:hypothetical protein
VQATTSRPVVRVTADGQGVVSHVGSRLLAEMAVVTGLDAGLGEVAWGGRLRRSAHDPGRVLSDLAVMFAEGASVGPATSCGGRWPHGSHLITPPAQS